MADSHLMEIRTYVLLQDLPGLCGVKSGVEISFREEPGTVPRRFKHANHSYAEPTLALFVTDRILELKDTSYELDAEPEHIAAYDAEH